MPRLGSLKVKISRTGVYFKNRMFPLRPLPFMGFRFVGLRVDIKAAYP